MSQPGLARKTRREMARDHADRCIEELDKRKCDYTLLFWLCQWDTIKHVMYGRDIITFITDDMKLTREDVCNPFFHNRITEVFEERGIRKISPRDCVSAYFKGKVTELMEKAGWTKPFVPFVFQPRTPPAGGCFVVYKTWPDGIAELCKTMFHRQFELDTGTIPVQNCYEIPFTGLGNLIVDFELEVHTFKDGEQTVDTLNKLGEEFPVWFYNRAIDVLGLDPETQTLTVCVKKKSRGDKASFHFTTNILGITYGNIKSFSEAVLAPIASTLKEYGVTKTFFHLSGQTNLCPGIGWDLKTIHGRQPISTMFGCKPNESNYPQLMRHIEFGDLVDGMKINKLPFEGPHTPTHKDALYLLYHSCFTIPKPNTIALGGAFTSSSLYTVSQVLFTLFMYYHKTCMGLEPIETPFGLQVKKAEVGQTMRGAAIPRALADTFLPEWFKSAAKGRQVQINTSMPCLDKKFEELKQYIPGLERKQLGRAQNLMCPYRLACGVEYMHNSNGVFVANHEGTLYCCCTSCYLDPNQDGRRFDVIGGRFNKPWVVITEEKYAQLASPPSTSSTSQDSGTLQCG